MPEKSRAGKKTEVVTTEVEVVNNKVDKKYMMALTGLCMNQLFIQHETNIMGYSTQTTCYLFDS